MPSSVIRSFGYDAKTSELDVIFQTGRHYVYSGVPKVTYQEMRKAFSKGEYFNAHIRGKFPYSRTRDAFTRLPLGSQPS